MSQKKEYTDRFEHFKQQFIHYFPPVRFAMILLIIITILVLFIPPLMGMSDNGTYQPILASNGLYEIPGNKEYYSGFIPTFKIMQYYNPEQYHLISLQNLFIQLALLLNTIFYSTTIFDVRFLAFMYWLIYLCAMYILLRGITKKMALKRSYIVSLLTIFILGDSSYLVYFNSFYSNALVFILLILFVGLGALAYQQRKPKYMFIVLGFQFLTALLFPAINKSSMYYMIGIIVTLLGAFLFVTDKRYKAGISSFIIALIPLSLMISSLMISPFDNKDKFNSMSTGVLRVAKDPGKALQDLGMEPQYEMMRGIDYDQTYVLEKSTSKSVKDHFIDYIHTWRKILYYIVHPVDLIGMLNVGVENQNIVNQGTGKGSHNRSLWATIKAIIFQGATQVKGAFLPKKFVFYMLASFTIIVIYIVVAIRGMQMGTKVYFARLLGQVGLILMMFISFAMPVIISGSANMIQQMEPASIIVDLLMIIVLADFMRHDIWIDKQQVMLYQVEGKAGGQKDEED